MNAFEFSVDRPENAFTLSFQDDSVSSLWETPLRDTITIAIVGTSGAADTTDLFGTIDTTDLNGESIKVFYDDQIDSIVISRSGLTFPPKSLSVTFANEFVTIWQADDLTKIIDSVPFSQIRNEQNGSFATVQACVTYLQNVFNQPDTNYQTLVMEGLI